MRLYIGHPFGETANKDHGSHHVAIRSEATGPMCPKAQNCLDLGILEKCTVSCRMPDTRFARQKWSSSEGHKLARELGYPNGNMDVRV